MIILNLMFFFVLGLIVGSFINVCIYRIPRDESLLTPRSHCPFCQALIRWYDNIPVASFVLLGRKCRHCGKNISFQYPLIELVTGICFMLVAWKYPVLLSPALSLPVYLYFTFVLITISGIDYFHRIIPDVFPFSLAIIALVFSPFNGALGFEWKMRVLNSVIGGIAGFGFLFLISAAGEKIMRQEVMGGGDLKLLGSIGILLGYEKILSTLFIASFVASILGITLIAIRKMQRKEYIPFGPFLALAAFLNLFLPGPWSFLTRFFTR